jgi:hypothetical protein
MSLKKHIGDLFEEEPKQWGLRGDPFLWRELRAHFVDTPIPSSAEIFEQELERAFVLLSGHPLSSSAHFRVERFAHGGMSSGGISPEFWRESALPILKNRYAET